MHLNALSNAAVDEQSYEKELTERDIFQYYHAKP